MEGGERRITVISRYVSEYLPLLVSFAFFFFCSLLIIACFFRFPDLISSPLLGWDNFQPDFVPFFLYSRRLDLFAYAFDTHVL